MKTTSIVSRFSLSMLFLLFFVGYSDAQEYRLRTRQSAFPSELRILATHLAGTLDLDVNEAIARVNGERSDELKVRKALMEMRGIRSNDADINQIAQDSAQILADAIRQKEKIDSMPTPDGAKVLLHGLNDLFSSSPTGESISSFLSESAKDSALKTELNRLTKLVQKLEIQSRLLTQVADKYAARPTPSSNGSRIEVEFNTLLDSGLYSFTNQGETLTDCLFEVTGSGAKGDKVVFCCFVEKWAQGETYFYIGPLGQKIADGGSIMHQCAAHTNKIDVVLLSPKYSTSVQYLYGRAERTQTHEILFEDVQMRGRYQKKEPGIFEDWQRSFTVTLDNVSLPACRFNVTFLCGARKKSWYRDLDEWKEGTSQKMEPGNDKLTSDPQAIEVDITFPDSDHKIRCSWAIQ